MLKQAKSDIKQAKKLGKRLSIIGHEEILNFLENSLARARLAHAYIFLGSEDVGKESVARWWLEKVLYQGEEGGERHSLESHPDVSVIERQVDEKTKKLKKLISIEQIRQLRERLGLTSFLNTYKVALVRSAETMSIEAANALLKTLEEPLGRTVIILLVQDVSRLPQTIVSRCQIIKFKHVSDKLIRDTLRQRGAGRDEAELLSRLAAGSPGLAFKFYENPERLAAYREKVESFLKITKAPIWQRFNFIDSEIDTRGDREEALKEIRKLLLVWQGALRDGLLCSLGFSNLMVNFWAKDRIESWSAASGADYFVEVLEEMKNTIYGLEQNVNIKLALENFLLCF
ncbi:hypothetical protein KKD84_04495 [Patescibacteria group bacterium]|nr:hypothetical protein [Patescibacteria group bacterium]